MRDGDTPGPEDDDERVATAAVRAGCLRFLLWSGVAAAIALALVLVVAYAGSASAGELGFSSALPRLRRGTQRTFLHALPLLLIATVPLLAALRRPRPRLALGGLAVTAVLWIGVSVAAWRDLRGDDWSEFVFGKLLPPLWLGAIVLLASARTGRRALGVDGRRAPRVLHTAAVATTVAAILASALLFMGHGAIYKEDCPQGQVYRTHYGLYVCQWNSEAHPDLQCSERVAGLAGYFRLRPLTPAECAAAR